MGSPYDTARELGIRLDNYRQGEHRTTCPKCSHLRKAPHRRVRCMAVKIDSDMLIWHCFHCGDSGGKRHAEARSAGHRNHNQTALRSLYR